MRIEDFNEIVNGRKYYFTRVPGKGTLAIVIDGEDGYYNLGECPGVDADKLNADLGITAKEAVLMCCRSIRKSGAIGTLEGWK